MQCVTPRGGARALGLTRFRRGSRLGDTLAVRDRNEIEPHRLLLVAHQPLGALAISPDQKTGDPSVVVGTTRLGRLRTIIPRLGGIAARSRRLLLLDRALVGALQATRSMTGQRLLDVEEIRRVRHVQIGRELGQATGLVGTDRAQCQAEPRQRGRERRPPRLGVAPVGGLFNDDELARRLDGDEQHRAPPERLVECETNSLRRGVGRERCALIVIEGGEVVDELEMERALSLKRRGDHRAQAE